MPKINRDQLREFLAELSAAAEEGHVIESREGLVYNPWNPLRQSIAAALHRKRIVVSIPPEVVQSIRTHFDKAR